MITSVLASGSSGNSVYLEAEGSALLVDCGLSVPELGRRLSAIGRDVSRIGAIFLTHDHGDHVGSSVVLARRFGIPLFATSGTHGVLRRLPPELTRVVRADQPVSHGGFTVHPIGTPHDGVESVAYRVDHLPTKRSMAVVTDLGYVPRGVVDRLQELHLLVVEHNHDERMLLEGPYPQMLKQRIRSPHGHLSNEQGAALVAGVLHPGLRRVVLAHLSETNNTPERARRAFERVNGSAHAGLTLCVAEQRRPTPLFEV